MRVKCISASGLRQYSPGKIYKVLNIDVDGYIQIMGDCGITWYCVPKNFIKIADVLNVNIKVL